jgi:hypothetical protein
MSATLSIVVAPSVVLAAPFDPVDLVTAPSFVHHTISSISLTLVMLVIILDQPLTKTEFTLF